jgi:hypothetical protein
MRRTIVQLIPCALISMTLLAGCASLYDDSCGPEGRDVVVVADILESDGDTLGYADLQVGETRRDEGNRAVAWYVFGEALRGHIRDARLVTSEDTSDVILQLSGTQLEPDIALNGQSSPYSGPMDFNQLFTRARTGGLTVILDTDLPSMDLMALPLTDVIQFNDWGRAHCS